MKITRYFAHQFITITVDHSHGNLLNWAFLTLRFAGEDHVYSREIIRDFTYELRTMFVAGREETIYSLWKRRTPQSGQYGWICRVYRRRAEGDGVEKWKEGKLSMEYRCCGYWNWMSVLPDGVGLTFSAPGRCAARAQKVAAQLEESECVFFMSLFSRNEVKLFRCWMPCCIMCWDPVCRLLLTKCGAVPSVCIICGCFSSYLEK